MIEIRRHLHRHPELSNREANTQAYLRQTLAEGRASPDIRDVAGFGLAVDIVGTGKPSNRKIAIRADIDALPIKRSRASTSASINPGVMHACGHDAHAAMGFAIAAHLHRARAILAARSASSSSRPRRTEPSGGRRVVEEGLLDDIDAAIGIHVDPYTPSGKIAVGSGPYTLACDNSMPSSSARPPMRQSPMRASMRSPWPAPWWANCRRSWRARSILTIRWSFR